MLERFPDARHLLGRDSPTAREAAVRAFQDPDGPQLLVCATRVAGQGITLTRASNVAFLELEWTPALHDQAEDRCHRIGQHDAVTAWYLLAAETIDETMAELIAAQARDRRRGHRRPAATTATGLVEAVVARAARRRALPPPARGHALTDGTLQPGQSPCVTPMHGFPGRAHMRRILIIAGALALVAVPTATAQKKPPKGSTGITIDAKPNPVVFSSPVTLSGRLSSNTAGVSVKLQKDESAPFGDKYEDAGLTATTTNNGSYSLSVKPGLNTQYRVVASASPPVTSAGRLVLVRPRVGIKTAKVSSTQVRFSGVGLPGARRPLGADPAPFADGPVRHRRKDDAEGRGHPALRVLEARHGLP